jgi:outer membrane receptor protein involved in Fe transport
MIDEDVNKNNFLATYSSALADGNFSLTLMMYQNEWNSADQIPERAVDENIIDRLGSLDTSLGGKSNRYSLSTAWSNEQWDAKVYAIHSSLDLFSNFTYFLDDPVNGDQFEQVDERNIFGGEIVNNRSTFIGDKKVDVKIGSDLRYDNISEVALYHTRDRQRLNTVRSDAANELSLGLFAQSTLALNERFHLHLGARYDIYSALVDSDIEQNSGDERQGKLSLKFGASYKVTDSVETYINVGQGLHSNDARGATITKDPLTGEASQAVDLIVPSTGAEVGIKMFDAERFNISTSFWYLHSDSELVFVGDAGNTEASRASERYGNEIAAYYWFDNRWNVDIELAWTRARFTENETIEGKYVEGSVPFVASTGITYGGPQAWNASLRYRYFAARSLDSFNLHRAQATGTINVGIGYKWQSLSVELEALNLTNSTDHDIDYFYESRLNGEPDEGVEDLHFHPVEPRTFRLTLAYTF